MGNSEDYQFFDTLWNSYLAEFHRIAIVLCSSQESSFDQSI